MELVMDPDPAFLVVRIRIRTFYNYTNPDLHYIVVKIQILAFNGCTNPDPCII